LGVNNSKGQRMAKGIQVPVTQTGLTQSINQAVKQVGAVNLPVNVNPAAFKNLSQPLGRITGLATEFEKSIAASNARVIAFGASVGIINSFQNALSQLVKTGIEVQKTLADISAISGATGVELSKLSDGIFDVAKNTGQSFKTASEAALEFSRQGLTLEETIKRTNDALTLSRFTGLSAADSVDTLTAAFNSFQESGVTTAEILNKLVAVDSAYAVSAADLAKAISRVGSVGIEAGVSLDELNAAVTAVQQRTARGGAVIGNAFKTIFTNLRSENAIKALRDIGVESLDLQGNLKPSLQVIKELAVAVQGLGEGERVQILETVASKYNINILSALIGDLTDKQSAFTGALEKSANAASEAYDRQKQLNETLAAAINNTTVSVTQLFNKLSEIGVNENLTVLLKFVNDLLSGFNKLLDSESVGGNIAKGLIKGISDVFFTVGLPIIAAIFVKLTRDIAQFGIESLKTILGINQQVRERQALEQAVVNTLIKDQQVMATILALSGDRAKQEQYLLNVYNQQIAALQKVQSIAQSVAPALQGAGLSATSGQVRRRAAGGYLPSQEASDVRRGVGGASLSSKVVSIPNFAFGGGKHGTMIANTSEYIVPNFANGGSAIFNPDMVKAYGLPAGAKKINASGGFIPNFKKGENPTKTAKYENPVNATARKPDGAVMLVPSPSIASAVNQISTSIGVKPSPGAIKEVFSKTGKNITGVFFDAFGLNDEKLKSSRNSKLKISEIQKYVENIIGNLGKTVINSFKPINRPALGKNQFLEFFSTKGGASGAVAAVAGSIFESAVDYALNPNSNPFAKDQTKQTTLDVQSLTPQLQDAFGVSGTYGQATKADYKISAERDKKFADQIIKNGLYEIRSNAASGYVPNFAKQSALSDAIGREIGAGVNPSQIRVTQDGRLRNSQNPNGLAVINTRDEPNGKVPNFARERYKAGEVVNGKKVGGQFKPVSAASGQTASATTPLTDQTAKLFLAFSGLTLISSTLQSTFKDTESSIAKFATATYNVVQTLSGGALLGNLVQQTKLPGLAGRGGFLGGVGRVAGNAGIIGAIGGAGIGIYQEIQAAREAERESIRESARKEISAISAVNITPEDTLVALQQKQTNIAATIADLNQRKKQVETKATPFIVAQQALMQAPELGGMAPYALASVKQESVLAAEDLEKLNKQLVESGLKKEEVDREILKLQTQIGFAKTRQEKTERAQTEEAEKRINLEQAFEKIALSILKGDNERLKTRAQIAAQDIRNASSLSDYQKEELSFRRKIEDFEEESTQKKRDLLNSTVQTLVKQGTLTTVTKEQADELKQVLESGTEIKDNAEIITKLGLKNAGVLNQQIRAIALASALEKERTEGLIERFTITQRAAIEEQSRLKLLESQNNLIIQQAQNARNLQLQTSQNTRTEKELNKQLEVQRLKAGISARGFGTPEEELRLLLMEKELSILRERNALEKESEDISRNKLEETRKAYEGFAKTLGSAVGNNFIAELSKAATPEAFAEIFTRMQTKAKEAIGSTFSETVSQIQTQYANPVYQATSGPASLERLGTRFFSNSTLKNQVYGPASLGGSSQLRNGNTFDMRVEAKLAEERNNALRSAETVRKSATEQNAKEGEIVQNTVDAVNKRVELEKNLLDLKIKGVNKLENEVSFLEKIAVLRAQGEIGKAKAGVVTTLNTLEEESQNFSENFAKNTTFAFRDGLTEALSAAISQTDDLGDALQNVARNFLQTIQQAFLQEASGQIVRAIGRSFKLKSNGGIVKKYAGGGKVVGGSGYKDDVPAMLTSGEFVMRKSAVQKYGMENLERMNNGGIFLPGVRGAGAISGYGDITKFAKQKTTSGATDVMMGGASSAFINLEDQSARLSRFGLLNEDTINQEIRSAQEQGLNLIREREAYRTAQRKAFQKQLVSTLAAVAINYGVGKITAPGPNTMQGMRNAGAPNSLAVRSGLAYGGMLRRYAAGGPTDDIPALLMGGEYVMSRQSTRKYGKQFFDAMNQGRVPRFAEGGMVGGANGTELGDKFDKLSTKLETTAASNISININVTNGGSSETQTQGDTNRGGIDYKKMGDQIRQVVIQTINEEKRLGGSLRSR